MHGYAWRCSSVLSFLLLCFAMKVLKVCQVCFHTLLRSNCKVTGTHVLPAGSSAPVGKQEAGRPVQTAVSVMERGIQNCSKLFKHIPWRILEYRDTSGLLASPVYLGHCRRYWSCMCHVLDKANDFTFTRNRCALRPHGDCSICLRPSICGCQNLIMYSITEQLRFSDTRHHSSNRVLHFRKSHGGPADRAASILQFRSPFPGLHPRKSKRECNRREAVQNSGCCRQVCILART